MYEQISEFARIELQQARETVKAQSEAQGLGRDELLGAFTRIKELEEANRKLRQESERLRS